MMNREEKKRVRALDDYDEVVGALRAAVGQRPPASLVEFAYQQLDRTQKGEELRVAFLANYTVEPLARQARVDTALAGLRMREWTGGYAQYFQDVVMPNPDLVRFDPDVLFLHLETALLVPGLSLGGGTVEVAEAEAFIVEHLDAWLQAALDRFRSRIVVANLVPPAIVPLGSADLKRHDSVRRVCYRVNDWLIGRAAADPRLYLFDAEAVTMEVGRRSALDPRMYHLSKNPWSSEFLAEAGRRFASQLRAVSDRQIKCLALDLDNTLWGGVVGEDGVGGIRIGEGDPVGEAYQAFQRYLLLLKRRGFLLAVCSKNNPEDAREAFLQRGMPLSLEDFSAFRANWNDKASNIRAIAEELNIGVSSIAFVDDSPIECKLVGDLLPGVSVIHLQGSAAEFPRELESTGLFDRLALTEEDLLKAEMYRQNAERKRARSEVSDLSSFLASLDTRATIRPAKEADAVRVEQLFNKTNQFNLTTRRYDLSQVQEFIASDRWKLDVVSVEDRFGKLGIVGLYLIDLGSDPPVLDSFLLSCRAIGRGIEKVMMNAIKSWLAEQRPGQGLSAAFIPTPKNRPAAGFLGEEGFRRVGGEEAGRQENFLSAEEMGVEDVPHIRVEVASG